MPEIELTQGQYALVDDIDYEYLNRQNWNANYSKSTESYYARRNIWLGLKYTTQLMHRVIMERVLGRKLVKGEDVDHINHDTLDNRRENLRLASRSQNKRNGNKHKDNINGYKGVDFNKAVQKYRARITVNYKTTHLGYFDSPEDAYDAYCKAANELHGEFAKYEL